uniref:Cytochrome c oxidase subunit 5A, mitochondrial n=1 Tax=Panagrolaimus sp. JU765 TaxID=591449 RepID=A0AC34Q123_9BILA
MLAYFFSLQIFHFNIFLGSLTKLSAEKMSLLRVAQGLSRVAARPLSVSAVKCGEHHGDLIMEKWPADRFDKHFIDYLSRPEIDGWEVRKALSELHDFDVIPDPKVVEAALRACRRVNDYALTIRFLEAIKIKCGSKKNRELVYGYIINQVKPVLDELGISTPEELGLDKPELFIPQPEYWWERKWYKEYGYDKKPGYEF